MGEVPILADARPPSQIRMTSVKRSASQDLSEVSQIPAPCQGPKRLEDVVASERGPPPPTIRERISGVTTDDLRPIHRLMSLFGDKETTIVNDDFQLLILRKETDTYVFRVDEASRSAALGVLAKFAADPQLNFSWHDAAVLSKKLDQRRGNRERGRTFFAKESRR